MQGKLDEIYRRIAEFCNGMPVMTQAEFEAAEDEIARLEAEAEEIENKMSVDNPV